MVTSCLLGLCHSDIMFGFDLFSLDVGQETKGEALLVLLPGTCYKLDRLQSPSVSHLKKTIR